MDKNTPHYNLTHIKLIIKNEGLKVFTSSAVKSAFQMGFSRKEMLELPLKITRKHFYKSMTTYQDTSIWQDVYHFDSKYGAVYIKFTLRENGAVVISFKELS